MNTKTKEGIFAGLTILVGFLLVVGLCVGAAFGCKGYNRYQARADANNKVKITAIQIRNQAQRVLIAQQKADIRFTDATGIRRAQDEIASTLTPIYVQFELVEALKAIATNGSNNSVVFVPTSPSSGLPIIPGLTENAGKGLYSGKH